MHYNFIEIGTSDFDTLIQTCPEEHVGLSIEPLIEYLDKLPNKPNVTKINAAASDEDGVIDIYTIPQEYIADDQDWIKGSNSVNHPHPLVKQYFGDRYDEIVEIRSVPKISWKSLIAEYKIESVQYLKIDTEGHDHVILNNYLSECEKQPNLFAETIEFEYYDKVSNIKELDKVVEKFKNKGYRPIYEEFQGVATNLTLAKIKTKTYKDLKGRTSDELIAPKWIFRAGNEALNEVHPDILKTYEEQLEQNPGYELFYFSKEDKIEFIKDQNDSDLLEGYNELLPEAFRTDLFRYTVLNVYGGVYMDYSMQSLIPLSEIIKHYTYIYAKDSPTFDGLYNAFIVSTKNNVFLKAAINKCLHNIKTKYYGKHPLSVTSPLMLKDLYLEMYNVSEIPLWEVGNDTMFYNHAVANEFINNELGEPIIRIKHPNHYNMLYSNGERYQHMWHSGRVFKTASIQTYKDLKGRKWEGEGIPKWIFKTGPHKVNELPDIYKHIYLDMLKANPGYELFYFSDEDCMLSIYDTHGESYFRTYDNVLPSAFKADFWRYCILDAYGGCYGDFSQVMMIPYDEVIDGFENVFVVDTPYSSDALYNAFMCSKPGDPVVKRALEISKHRIDNKIYASSPLDVTGPKVLGTAYCDIVFRGRQGPIHVGIHGKTRILDNEHIHSSFIIDESKRPIVVKKINNHFSAVYKDKQELHYDRMWREGRAFRP